MLIFAKYTNAEDAAYHYTFLDEANPAFVVVAPMTQLDFTIDERTIDRPRMQLHGSNPTFSYDGAMTIDITGMLMKDNPDDYVAERRTFVTALRYLPDTQPTVRKRGVLELQWSGDAESMKADVTIQKISLPIAALSPSRTDYMITFSSFKPWFVGSSSGDLYYVS